jgi:hypothetical protein
MTPDAFETLSPVALSSVAGGSRQRQVTSAMFPQIPLLTHGQLDFHQMHQFVGLSRNEFEKLRFGHFGAMSLTDAMLGGPKPRQPIGNKGRHKW